MKEKECTAHARNDSSARGSYLIKLVNVSYCSTMKTQILNAINEILTKKNDLHNYTTDGFYVNLFHERKMKSAFRILTSDRRFSTVIVTLCTYKRVELYLRTWDSKMLLDEVESIIQDLFPSNDPGLITLSCEMYSIHKLKTLIEKSTAVLAHGFDAKELDVQTMFEIEVDIPYCLVKRLFERLTNLKFVSHVRVNDTPKSTFIYAICTGTVSCDELRFHLWHFSDEVIVRVVPENLWMKIERCLNRGPESFRTYKEIKGEDRPVGVEEVSPYYRCYDADYFFRQEKEKPVRPNLDGEVSSESDESEESETDSETEGESGSETKPMTDEKYEGDRLYFKMVDESDAQIFNWAMKTPYQTKRYKRFVREREEREKKRREEDEILINVPLSEEQYEAERVYFASLNSDGLIIDVDLWEKPRYKRFVRETEEKKRKREDEILIKDSMTEEVETEEREKKMKMEEEEEIVIID